MSVPKAPGSGGLWVPPTNDNPQQNDTGNPKKKRVPKAPDSAGTPPMIQPQQPRISGNGLDLPLY